MSGTGSRFIAAGYKTLKPLIKVNGKPIIEYVVSMFPGDHDFLFICREDHAITYDLLEYLPTLCKKSKVVTIKEHKLGPVYAALQARDRILPETPVLLSYCDYFMKWDFNNFCDEVSETKADGNVVCYTGFHPHLLHSRNVYAGCLVNERHELLEIREKFSFEKDKTKGYHSAGAYYFKTGKLMIDYFDKSVETGNSLNGEFYASMVYNLLLKDDLKVTVFDKVSHFCQWGTPGDLKEFLYWSEIFLKYQYR